METAQAANKTRPKKLDDIMEGLAEFIDTCSKLHTFKAGRYGLTYQDAGDIPGSVGFIPGAWAIYPGVAELYRIFRF